MKIKRMACILATICLVPAALAQSATTPADAIQRGGFTFSLLPGAERRVEGALLTEKRFGPLFVVPQIHFPYSFFSPGWPRFQSGRFGIERLPRGDRPREDDRFFYYRSGPVGESFLFGAYDYPLVTEPLTSVSVTEEGAETVQAPAAEAGETQVPRSVSLEPGMSPQQALDLLGSPITRIRFGGAAVWRYSDFSLFFENGRLKEIR